MPINYWLALILMFGPYSPDQDQYDTKQLDACYVVRPLVQKFCLAHEIIDERENKYIFARNEHISTDIHIVRYRCLELYNAPKIHWAMVLPCRETINENLSFNWAYRDFLEKQLTIANLEEEFKLTELLHQTRKLYEVWDWARDAQSEYYYVTVRRKALKQIKEEIGHNAFYQGLLPPYVPIENFKEIK